MSLHDSLDASKSLSQPLQKPAKVPKPPIRVLLEDSLEISPVAEPPAIVAARTLAEVADREATNLTARLGTLIGTILSLPSKVEIEVAVNSGERVAIERDGANWRVALHTHQVGPLEDYWDTTAWHECSLSGKATVARALPELLRELHSRLENRVNDLVSANAALDTLEAMLSKPLAKGGQ